MEEVVLDAVGAIVFEVIYDNCIATQVRNISESITAFCSLGVNDLEKKNYKSKVCLTLQSYQATYNVGEKRVFFDLICWDFKATNKFISFEVKDSDGVWRPLFW